METIEKWRIFFQNFFPTVVIIIAFILFTILNKHFKKGIRVYFYAVAGCILFLTLTDASQYYGELVDSTSIKRMISACGSYILRPTISYLSLLLYARFLPKKTKLLFGLPILFNALIVLSALTGNHMVFYYGEDGEIIRGPLLAAPFIATSISLLFVLAIGYNRIKNHDYQEFILLVAITISAIGATFLELFLRVQGLIAFVCALLLVFYYMFFLVSNLSVDELTGALVRARLYARIKYYPNNYSVIVYDLNGLKKINDEKGHYEGDKALKTLADATFEIIPKTASFYRMGGDEFVIFYPTSENEKVLDFVGKLKEAFAATDYKASIGYATQEGDMYFGEVLLKADEMMYAEKMSYKK